MNIDKIIQEVKLEHPVGKKGGIQAIYDDGWSNACDILGQRVKEVLNEKLTVPYIRSEYEFQLKQMQELGINTNACLFEQCVNTVLYLAKSNPVEFVKWLTRKDSPYAIAYGEDKPFVTKDKSYTIEEVYQIFLQSTLQTCVFSNACEKFEMECPENVICPLQSTK